MYSINVWTHTVTILVVVMSIWTVVMVYPTLKSYSVLTVWNLIDSPLTRGLFTYVIYLNIMSLSTNNSKFTINTHGSISDCGVMWYEYDPDMSAYDMDEIDFVFHGVLVRACVHHDVTRDDLLYGRQIHMYTSYNPVLAGPAPVGSDPYCVFYHDNG